MEVAAPKLTKNERKVARELASTASSEASSYMRGYVVRAGEVAMLLAKLRASPEKLHRRAYEIALRGVVDGMRKEAPSNRYDVNTLVQKAATLNGEWAAEFKADLFVLHAENLRQVANDYQSKSLGGPPPGSSVAIGEYGRSVAKLLGSDPSNIVGILRLDGAAQGLSHLFTILLEYHPTGAEEISQIFAQLGKETVAAASREDRFELERHANNTGFVFGELQQGYAEWRTNDAAKVKKGAEILSKFSHALGGLAGLFPAREIAAVAIGEVFSAALDRLASNELVKEGRAGEYVVHNLRGVFTRALETLGGITAESPLAQVVRSEISRGWGESASGPFFGSWGESPSQPSSDGDPNLRESDGNGPGDGRQTGSDGVPDAATQSEPGAASVGPEGALDGPIPDPDARGQTVGTDAGSEMYAAGETVNLGSTGAIAQSFDVPVADYAAAADEPVLDAADLTGDTGGALADVSTWRDADNVTSESHADPSINEPGVSDITVVGATCQRADDEPQFGADDVPGDGAATDEPLLDRAVDIAGEPVLDVSVEPMSVEIDPAAAADCCDPGPG